MNRTTVLVLFFALFTGALCAQSEVHQDIRVSLEAGETVHPIILMEDDTALPEVPSQWDKEKKGRFVFRWLQDRADRSQTGLRVYLENEQLTYRSFYLVNAVKAYALNARQVHEIAVRPDVQAVLPDPWIAMERPVQKSTLSFRQDLPWGLLKVRVDSVWNAGYKGQGVVIGGQDTGYEWYHPALQGSYRGSMGDTAIHDYNWHDAVHMISPLHNDSIIDPSNNPCGLDIDEPCDDTNHGTHTMGTMTGSNDSVLIGMAPEAKWIGCRNMERGYGKPSTYLECFEWFLAPTDLQGDTPDPSRAPHVINNSWSCPEFEGCTPDVFPMMEEALNNLVAAGIVVVTSAGNSGPQCGSVSTPPSIHDNSYAVGASRPNDTIAWFSSRGPVTVDSSFILKPDISAPGWRVWSSIRNGGYTFYSGTSMAGPHVAGLVALIIQANPDLAGRVQEIKEIINSTAVPLFDTLQCGAFYGQDNPNATYGFGRIDAWNAVRAALDWGTPTDDPEGQASGLIVFPNPGTQKINFQAHRDDKIRRLSIYNIRGQCVYRVNPRVQAWQVATASWSPGMYFYRVETVNGWVSGTFVKE